MIVLAVVAYLAIATFAGSLLGRRLRRQRELVLRAGVVQSVRDEQYDIREALARSRR